MLRGKRVIFPSHINCGNHGCEAITKSTCELLRLNPNEVIIASSDVSLDNKCKMNKYGHLIEISQIDGLKTIDSLIPRVIRKIGIDRNAVTKHNYKRIIDRINKDSIVFITGGDIYCYDNSDWLSYLNRVSKEKGAITILWGCSIEKNRINKQIENDLNTYDYITVRESLTKETLEKMHIKSNISIFPDPAFGLKPEKNDFFNWEYIGEAVGINLSNHIIKTKEMFDHFLDLLRYILEQTSYSIVLIPHVFWEKENDLKLLQKFKDILRENNRVFIIDEELNCNQLKYNVSKCKLFMGARTHSVIAAYSTTVPALAFGYSVKSRGIAKDIFGTEKNMVLTINNDTSSPEIIESFQYLRDNQKTIKKQLELKMVEYSSKLKNEEEFISCIL